jgi:hypothetical protein
MTRNDHRLTLAVLAITWLIGFLLWLHATWGRP